MLVYCYCLKKHYDYDVIFPWELCFHTEEMKTEHIVLTLLM